MEALQYCGGKNSTERVIVLTFRGCSQRFIFMLYEIRLLTTFSSAWGLLFLVSRYIFFYPNEIVKERLTLRENTISLTSEWHFVKTFFFKIGLETNLE
jgi:hypothetical protein